MKSAPTARAFPLTRAASLAEVQYDRLESVRIHLFHEHARAERSLADILRGWEKARAARGTRAMEDIINSLIGLANCGMDRATPIQVRPTGSKGRHANTDLTLGELSRAAAYLRQARRSGAVGPDHD